MSNKSELREAERKKFEAFISSDPFGLSVSKYPDDETKYAWPGSYRDYKVELAWQAWLAASEANQAEGNGK